MPRLHKKRFILYSKKPIFQKRLSDARQRLRDFLDVVKNPYIAFSGGKDSHVCLSLAREIAEATDIPAVYFDADCAYPEVSELLTETPNCIEFPASEPFLKTLAKHGLSHPKIEEITMKTTVYEPIAALLEKYRFDGGIYGLRAEESQARRWHARRNGAIFQYSDQSIHKGIRQCQPIHDWSYEDVWAYIVSEKINYCKTYDKKWDMPEAEQRISYWAGESNRNFGRYAHLKQEYPELFNQLIKACPEARQFL